MDDRILVAIDASPTDDNRSALTRTEQIGEPTGARAHVPHVGRGHIVPEDLTGGSRLGVWSAEDHVESVDRRAVQELIDRLNAAGIDAHGEIIGSTEHDLPEAIPQRARQLDVDLLVLGHQHPYGSRCAERTIHQHPPYSVLLARPPRAT